jgi:hypothetical protein
MHGGDIETAGKPEGTLSRFYRGGLKVLGRLIAPGPGPHPLREQPIMAGLHSGCPSDLQCEPTGGKRSGGSDPASPMPWYPPPGRDRLIGCMTPDITRSRPSRECAVEKECGRGEARIPSLANSPPASSIHRTSTIPIGSGEL